MLTPDQLCILNIFVSSLTVDTLRHNMYWSVKPTGTELKSTFSLAEHRVRLFFLDAQNRMEQKKKASIARFFKFLFIYFFYLFSPSDWRTDGRDKTETGFIYVCMRVLGSDHIAYIRKKKEKKKKIQQK